MSILEGEKQIGVFDRIKETYRGAGDVETGVEYDAKLDQGFSEMSVSIWFH